MRDPRAIGACAWLCPAEGRRCGPQRAADRRGRPGGSRPRLRPQAGRVAAGLAAVLGCTPAQVHAADGGEISEEIVVTAPLARDRLDLVSAVSVLDAAALLRDARPQIGDSLLRLPGVSASTFGPNASRPVLRGLTGERVRVLTDGIGAFDVSNTSADHAVAIDPLSAERIEVVRGPGALRFGASAVGGLVNVLDRRIPRALPERGAAADLSAGLGSAALERSLGGAVVIAAGNKLALRAGGSLVETGELRTGGFILSADLRREALNSPDPEVQRLAGLRGRIPNTDSRMRSVHAGLALIEGAGTLGVAVSRMESRYGVPIRFDVTGAQEAEAVFLDARQTRADVRAGLALAAGPVERIDLRGGAADYVHVEGGEDPAETGTLFANRGHELRIELAQRARGAWRGVIGGQIGHRNFRAIGEEAFVPPNISDEWGLFAVQELTVGALVVEGGIRVERRSIRSAETAFARGFTTVSGSLGGVWRVSPAWRVAATVARSARPPAPEELLADGPHVGTQAFEIGDRSLGIERSTAIELAVRGRGERWRAELTGHATRFSGFIYQDETGAVMEGLPVFAFRAAPARTWGLELEAGATLARLGGLELEADVTADLVRARILGVGPAPRTPPARVLGGLRIGADRWSVRVDAEHSLAQDRVSALEARTGSFTSFNAFVDWQPMAGRRDVRMSVAATNLLDREARRHASFLKEFAPLAGRDVRLAVRAEL